MIARRNVVPALILAVLCAAAASLFVGAATLSPASVLRALVTGEGAAGIVVRELRVPRTLLALITGAFLGLAGAALQGLLRNPLADPGVFGAPQGAALGAVAVLHLGGVQALSMLLPAAAILGAFGSVALVVIVAGRGSGVTTVVLAGLAVGSLASAAVSIVISLSPNPFAVTEIVFWLLGSFEDRSMRHVLLLLPFAAVASLLLLRIGEGLRLLVLGEEAARTLGLSPGRLRLVVVAATALGTGACVAVSGAIGFVGLVAPHLARGLVGPDPARVLVPAALIGALLTLGADLVVRLVPSTTEIGVGAVTAVLGVPFFLGIVGRRRAAMATGAA